MDPGEPINGEDVTCPDSRGLPLETDPGVIVPAWTCVEGGGGGGGLGDSEAEEFEYRRDAESGPGVRSAAPLGVLSGNSTATEDRFTTLQK